MRRISLIVIHCSDSAFGDAVTIRRWNSFGWKVEMIKGRESFPSAFHSAIQVMRTT